MATELEFPSFHGSRTRNAGLGPAFIQAREMEKIPVQPVGGGALVHQHSQNRWTVARSSCSVLNMRKILVALLLMVTPALAQENATAYEALRTVGNRLNRDYFNRVISVSGVDGNPQPARWKILLADSHARGGVREVEVANDRIVSERTPVRPVVGTAEGSTINTSRLNLDSSGAYAVASHTAEKSNTQFSTVSYTLRTDESGDPLWIVTLEDQARRPVGTIYIGANSGNVTRTEGMFPGTTMRDVQIADQDRNENQDQNEGDRGIFSGPKARIKRAFRRAQDEARDTFQRVRHSFADFIRGS
jgi:hypothetical protein